MEVGLTYLWRFKNTSTPFLLGYVCEKNGNIVKLNKFYSTWVKESEIEYVEYKEYKQR